MLLEFKTKNYKSFVEEASFSMVAAPKQKGLDYSLMKTKIKGKEIKGLSSSVIYGPNAAGKTNIIGAMDVLRAIVLRGNIRNSEEKSSPNPAAAALELIPNNNEMESKPVCFEIEFYEEDGDNLVLKDKVSEEDRDKLNDIFGKPMVIVSTLTSDSKETKAALAKMDIPEGTDPM